MPPRFRARPFSVPDEDWRILTMAHPSVLIVGDEALTSEFIDVLFANFRPPLARWIPRDAAAPSHPCGTLIVRNADRFDQDEQRRLDQWLSNGRMPQVVTTAAVPIFPLVEQGSFLAPLYYRLNVIHLEFST